MPENSKKNEFKNVLKSDLDIEEPKEDSLSAEFEVITPKVKEGEGTLEAIVSESEQPKIKRKPRKKKEKKEKEEDEEEENSLAEKIEGYFSFLKSERFQKISGLTLLLLSVYLFVAFTSFLFTWQNDQDKVLNPLLFSPDVQVSNWLGKLGALTSHLFLHHWFGIASYTFVLVFFVFGIKILLQKELLPAIKVLTHGFFFLVWTSITLGYIFHDKWFYMGGGFGFFTSGWLNSVIGQIGTGCLSGFSMLVYLVVVYNISFKWMKEKEQQQEAVAAAVPVANAIPSPLPTATATAALVTNITIKEQETPTEEQPNEPGFFENILNTIKGTEEKKDEAVELDANVENKDEKKEGVEFLVAEVAAEALAAENKELPFGEYDPTLDLSSYQHPSLDLLEQYGSGEAAVNTDELTANKDKIVTTLNNYGIQIDKIKATIGPTVTLYEIIPSSGTRISKIKNLEDDIALSLAALGIRIIAPMPGKGTIGIEVPNINPQMVSMKNILASEKFQNTTMDLPIALGKTISNETFIADLAKMPHLLMAGATGQGKSVGLNAILVSLLYKKHPSQIKFVLVDPKKVELNIYNKIERHFLAKLPDTEEAIITDTKKVVHTLNSLCIEMDQRYELLKEAGVRNLKEYNAKFIARKLNPNKGHKFLPYIILVVDEFADLIMTAGKEVETPIARLAQLARAIGIHLIIATQRPSVNIITGVIKANFPARIAFRVSSKIDSRTILDTGGADQLIGKGDMLLSIGNDLIRIQCAFVDTPEVDKITEFIGSQRGYPSAYNLPEYHDETEENGMGDMDPSERDSMFNEAAKMVVQFQQGSASLLQRKLKLGYNRAGRIVDQLEAAGIIGKFEGSKAREVLIKDLSSLEQILNSGRE